MIQPARKTPTTAMAAIEMALNQAITLASPLQPTRWSRREARIQAPSAARRKLKHLLKARERIDFKLAVLVFKCLNGTAPAYLADELSHSSDFVNR